MRILRLALGLLVVWQAIQIGEWAPGLLGGLFVLLALTNTGCCGANGCGVPATQNEKENVAGTNGIEFEEVTSTK